MPTALIVEDEPEANKLLGMLLQLRGYQASAAFTGEEALRRVNAACPDVIFLDLMLPDLNGYEVCKALKSAKSTCLIPLVIVTARVAAENRVESYCLGADDYVAKPYTPDQIYAALDRSSAWRKQADGDRVQVEVPLEQDDEIEALRRLAQLRSLILARSPLALDHVSSVIAAIKEVWCLAASFPRAPDFDGHCTLAYTLTAAQLTLTFHECAGWLASFPAGPDITQPCALSEARFGQIIADQQGRRLTLIKPFAAD